MGEWLNGLKLRLQRLLNRRQLERNLQDELAFHLAMREQQLHDDGAADSRDAALRRFGNVARVQEECRENWMFAAAERLFEDVRYALRIIRRNRGFSVIAIITLALGIGMNTVMFGVVDKVLLQPLPYPESDRLVTFTQQYPQGEEAMALTPLLYHFWLENNRAFEAFAAYLGGSFNLITDSGAQRLNGMLVTSGFFNAIGVQPFLGRGFVSGDDSASASPVLVLSYGAWQRYFGQDPGVVGRTFRLNDNSYRVIGVLPRGFSFDGPSTAVFAPLALVADPRDFGRNYTAVARLKAGMTLENARADVTRVFQHFDEAYPRHLAGMTGVGLMPFQHLLTGNVHQLLLVLWAAVTAILLIACANVASLLLSRAAARQKEIATRIAIGAAAGRILRQFFVESVVLSLISGVVGAVLSAAGIRVLVSMDPVLTILARDAGVDLRVLVFSLLISVGTAFIFGASAFFHARSVNPYEALKSSGAFGQNSRRGQLASILIVSEVALASVLLVSASLLILTFHRLQTIPFGFDIENVKVIELPMSSQKYQAAAAVNRFDEDIRERLRNLPGVVAVATSSGAPLVRTLNHRALITGQPEERRFAIEFRSVSPDYFETLGIRVLRGRGFAAGDSALSAPVIVINERLASRFSTTDAIGQRLTLAPGAQEEEAPREIIGVVSNVSDRPPGSPLVATVYVLRSQTSDAFNQYVNNYFDQAVVIRTTAGIDLTNNLLKVIASVDPALPISRVRTIREIAADSLARQRFNMALMSSFAAVALLLTLVGLYGVLSYQVVQRTREIGVRTALGAGGSEIVWNVVRRGITLAVSGLVVGMAGAFGLTRFLSSWLYGVSPTNPWTYIAISVIFLAVALLASYFPARRAAHIDPLVALRDE